MKKLLIVLALSLIFSLNIFSQKPLSKDATLEETKNWLKKSLVKKVADISGINFDGCQITITLKSTPVVGKSSSGGGPVGGTTPTDEAGRSLSSGPGEPFTGDSVKRKIIFSLNDLDISNIKTGTGLKKGQSVVILPASGQNSIKFSEKQNSLIPSEKEKITNRSWYQFNIKTEDAETFAEAFRQASRQCSEQK
jgi:hypothetical protein